MHRITGALKEYDWGVPDGLAAWCGRTEGRPQAELWFGLHPSGPSPLVDSPTTLADECHPDDVPILVKLLAAARPLSIQVHPNAEQAARGYAHQGDAAMYSDDQEKTELLVALEPFEAFCGWRDMPTAARVLAQLPGTDDAVEALEAGDRETALRALLQLASTCDIRAWNAELPLAAERARLNEADIEAYRTVVREFPLDPGVPVTVLLDRVSLDVGDAVYVPAGIPHSYIRGIGLEVMTSSDNVLRMGLTGKPVHRDEAISCLDWSAAPMVIRGRDHIAPAGAPFSVDLVREARVASGSYRLLLAIDGPLTVKFPDVEVDLAVGEALALAAVEPEVRVHTSGRAAVVRATV